MWHFSARARAQYTTDVASSAKKEKDEVDRSTGVLHALTLKHQSLVAAAQKKRDNALTEQTEQQGTHATSSATKRT